MEDINLANLSDDELDQFVTRIEANVAAMRAAQMKGLREIDSRQTPLADGCRSLVEWVTGRLDVAPDTAKELVATAMRLESAPMVEAAALDGTISFDRAAQCLDSPPTRRRRLRWQNPPASTSPRSTGRWRCGAG